MTTLSGDIVTCPRCFSEMCHRQEVTVFSRRMDDGPGHKFTITTGGDLTASPVEAKDLPGRRTAVLLKFECEDCAVIFWAQFLQHKGSEVISIWLDGVEDTRKET